MRAHPEYHSLTDVLLACKHHSEIDLSQLDTDADYLATDAPTRARILRTAKIVRDADKLANLEFFCFDQFQTILNMTEVLIKCFTDQKLSGHVSQLTGYLEKDAFSVE